ncbi:MAG: hypothetical protein JW839_13540 [Candidatus Lokiarchaeota archaeon]|nr:hypothetical protein [Candidatus Lokiarchaeota archaeon]
MSDLYSYLLIDNLNFLWIVVIGLFFVLAITMMAKLANKETLPSTKRLYVGYVVFLVVLGISRFLNQVSNYYRDNSPLPNYVDDPMFQLFKRSSYILGLLAFAFLVFGFERHFLKMILNSRGIFTLIPLAIATLAFFLDYDMLRLINYVGIGINMLMIASLYLYVAAKTSGHVRRASINSIVGIAFIGIGFLLNSSLFDDLFHDLAWLLNVIGACMNIAGALFVYASTRQEKASAPKNNESPAWSVEQPAQ